MFVVKCGHIIYNLQDISSKSRKSEYFNAGNSVQLADDILTRSQYDHQCSKCGENTGFYTNLWIFMTNTG